MPATIWEASITQTARGSGSGQKSQSGQGSTNHYFFPFWSSKPEWLALLVFHNMKTHADVSSATGIKSVFETFLVDPQNAKNQNC